MGIYAGYCRQSDRYYYICNISLCKRTPHIRDAACKLSCYTAFSVLLLKEHESDLNQRNQSCTDHDTMRNIVLADVKSLIRADTNNESTNTKSTKRPHVANPRNTKKVCRNSECLSDNTNTHTYEEEHRFLTFVNNSKNRFC